MMKGDPPPITEKYGYSCNVWYSVQLSSLLFGTTYRRAWFTSQFNPIGNVDSSNPCAIYIDVSKAVQQSDVGSKIIATYRSQLMSIVDDLLQDGILNAIDAEAYRQSISTEAVASFRPEIWRLDLEQISFRKYGVVNIDRLKQECKQNANQTILGNPPQVLQSDEYLILDLQDGEYDSVIVG